MMSNADLGRALLELPGATEDFPFGPEAAVYRVGGKMFALVMQDAVPPRINLKCDPERAIILRDTWAAITPGYHMSKRHWNTVTLGLDLPEEALPELIAHSYELVLSSLPKKDQARIRGAG